MKSSVTTILFFWQMLLTLELSYASRILGIFVHPGQSHFDSFHPIMNGLAKNGHDVTVISYFNISSAHLNYKEILIDAEGSEQFANLKFSVDELGIPSRSLYQQALEFVELIQWGQIICDFTLKSTAIDEIFDLHRSKPFDLIVTEMFNTDCMLGTIYKIGAPYVSITSCALEPWHYDRIGLPGIPSYLGTESSGFSHKMNFAERMNNWISLNVFKRLYRLRQIYDNELIRSKYGEGIPDVQEIAENVSLVLINQHFSFGGPRPLVSQAIEIGGVHINEKKPLPINIKTLLDNATHGAIVISWGSIVQSSSMHGERLDGTLKAFGRLKQIIIWKWESDSLPNKPDNVYTFKWLPQRDILCHPNVKLFWSHGGNLGTSEGIHCGVPILITPFFGDQFLSGNAVINREMGTILRYEDISENSIYDTVSELLKPSYQENAQKVSFAFRNRPLSPVDTSVWWIEHVIATGGLPFGRAQSIREMYWFTYHSVDVVVVLASGMFATIFVFYKLMAYCCCLRQISKAKKKIKMK